MRTLLPTLLTVGLLSTWAGQAGAQPDARAVIQKAIKAHGGEEVLTKFKAARSKAKGKIELFDGLPFTQETVYQLPNQFKEVTELEAAGQKVAVTTGLNGEQGWMDLNGKTQAVDDKLLTELKEAAHLLRACRLTYLLDEKDCKLSPLGEGKVNDRSAVGVRAECKGFRDISLWFDKDSGLLLKTERKALDTMAGQEILEERLLTEYQKIEGMMSPRKIVVNRDGKRFMEAELVEVKLLEKVDPAIFIKP